MENTFFLARVMGLALIIGGMSLLFYYKDMKKVMSDLQNNYFLLYLFGFFIVVLGLILTLSHNVWEGNLQSTITFLNWIILILGILIMFLPKALLRLQVKGLSEKIYVFIGIISILVGFYLALAGFMAG